MSGGLGRLGHLRLGIGDDEAALSISAPAVAIAAALPAPTVALGGIVLVAPTMAVAVALPGPDVRISVVVDAVPLEIPVALPAPAVHISSGLFVDAVPAELPVTLPAPALRFGLRLSPPPIAVGVTASSPRVTIGAVDVEVPTPLVFELTVNGSTIDVSSMVVGDFDYERPLGGVPTGTVTLEDPDGTIPWPPDPGIDPFAETVGALPFLRITGTGVLLEGQVPGPERRELWPGFGLTLRVEGWRRLAQLSPVQPLSGATTSQDSPDGTVVTADLGSYIGWGGSGGHPPDVFVIRDAAAWFTGPAELDTSDVPFRRSTSLTLVPRGQALDSVFEQLAALLPDLGDDVWWIGPGPALHWRSAVRAGTLVSEYHGPSSWVAPFRITDDFTDPDGIVPTTLVDSLKGGDVREGVYVTDVAPWYSATSSSGPSGAGYDLLSSGSGEPGRASLVLGGAMIERRAFRRVLTVELPDWPVGWPEPTEGALVSVQYGATVPEPALYTIRNVRGVGTLHGQGVSGIHYTLELGDADRRSYVAEARRRDRGIAAVDQPRQQVVTLETPTISDLGVPAEGDPPIPQYVTARPIGASGERVELWGGLVDWSILIDDEDIGPNVGDGLGLGWSLADATTDVVFEYGDSARRFGFAYTTLLAWRTEASIAGGRRVKVRAELRTGL